MPTTLELGYANSDYSYWMGCSCRPRRRARSSRSCPPRRQKACDHPAVVAKFAAQGIEPMPMTPAEFDALISKEIEENIALVKAAGIKFN